MLAWWWFQTWLLIKSNTVYLNCETMFAMSFLIISPFNSPFHLMRKVCLTCHRSALNFPHLSHSHAPTRLLCKTQLFVHWQKSKRASFSSARHLNARGYTLLRSLASLERWQPPPYGCHSLNSYNICLCQDNWVHSVYQQQDNGHFSLRLKIMCTMKCRVKAFKAFFMLWMNRASYKTHSWASYSMWV